jgi:hypothetical protein
MKKCKDCDKLIENKRGRYKCIDCYYKRNITIMTECIDCKCEIPLNKFRPRCTKCYLISIDKTIRNPIQFIDED